MSDFLVELGANPTARNVIKRLGLPLPMPMKLDRGTGAWPSQPLAGKTVVVGSALEVVHLLDQIVPALIAAGAATFVEAPAATAGASTVDAGELPDGGADLLVFDATGVTSVDHLKNVWAFFQPRVKKLAKHGRVVVVTRKHDETTSISTAAARRAIEGFVKSAAKELGGKGITANEIVVSKGKEDAVGPALTWILSPRSAFVTAQPFVLDGKPKSPDAVGTEQSLAGKVALVTGSARGIGEATAETLAREGAHVLVLDRPADADAIAEVAARIGGTGVPVDVTAEDAAETIWAAAEKAGGLDIIVHNAGVTRDKTLGNMDDARWDLVLDVNLRAILALTDALAPKMNDGGRIIALSSVAGIAGNFGQTNYGMSKAGVIGFISGAAAKLAKRGITVNGIAPGFIETRMTAAIPVATREGARRLSALSQGGQPIDIAEAVTFLASPASWGMSGHVLRVCGGALIGA